MNMEVIKKSIFRYLEAKSVNVGEQKVWDTCTYIKSSSALVTGDSASALLSGNANYAAVSTKPGVVIPSNFAKILAIIAESYDENSKENVAIGTLSNGSTVAEYVDGDGRASIAVYNPKTGSIKASVRAADADDFTTYKISDPCPAIDNNVSKEKNGELCEVIIASLIPEAMKDEEFSSNFDVITKGLFTNNKKKLTKKSIENINTATAICADNMFARLLFPELKSTIYVNEDFVDENKEVSLLNVKTLKKNPLTTELYGHFSLLDVAKDAQGNTENEEDKLFTAYKIGGDEYKDSPYKVNVDFSSVVIPDFVRICAEHIALSRNAKSRIINVWFRGSAGTGKSTATTFLASILDLPKHLMVGSSDMDSQDLLGGFVPVVKDGALTYKYEESPLVKAFRYGGVLEFAEINAVPAGVLMRLNSIMEPNGFLVLPDGEVIKRHPNTIVCFTTNISYEGCRDMNAALLDRIDMAFDINNPTVDDMAERAALQTGFTDMKLLTEMAQITADISAEMEKQGIEDGTAGLRSLINWAKSTMITGDPYTSGMYTLISKTSVNKEDRDLLAKYLNSASFAKRNRARKI